MAPLELRNGAFSIEGESKVRIARPRNIEFERLIINNKEITQLSIEIDETPG